MKKIVTELLNEIVNPLLDMLSKEGRKMTEKAFAGSDFINRTNNLRDSYGYGIYYKGDLVRRGNLGSEMAEEPRDWYGEDLKGRTELNSFLDEHEAPKDKIQLIVVAAMPYSVVLENGRRGHFPLSRKYSVISSLTDSMDKLAAEFPLFNAESDFLIDNSNR